MNSKTIFKKHLLWNTYNPKNFKFLFFNHKGEATLKKQNWDSFYEFIKSFFICNCKIKFKNSVLNCKKVEFHEKFGWVLSHNLVYIFLGKLDISDTRLFLTIGRNSYLSGDSLISGFGKVNIGSFTCIGEHFHAIIGNDSHSFQKVGYINFSENERLIYEGLMFGKKKKPLPGFILIGNNCWIGRNVTIKNDVYVGDGACIGESSLVLSGKTLKAEHLYAGIPAEQKKILKTKKLQPKKWWNWNKQRFRLNQKIFLDP